MFWTSELPAQWTSTFYGLSIINRKGGSLGYLFQRSNLCNPYSFLSICVTLFASFVLVYIMTTIFAVPNTARFRFKRHTFCNPKKVINLLFYCSCPNNNIKQTKLHLSEKLLGIHHSIKDVLLVHKYCSGHHCRHSQKFSAFSTEKWTTHVARLHQRICAGNCNKEKTG